MDQYNNIKIHPISNTDRYIHIERKGKNIIRSTEDVKKNSCPNINLNTVTHSSVFADIDQEGPESEPNTFDGRLDSVRSGESLIKCYTFESECNKDTDKIIAFWKAIDEHKEIQPVRSTIRERQSTVGSERSESTNSERSEEYAWYNALMEMKKQKMDQVALVANGRQCHFCDLTQTCASKSKRSQTALDGTEELDAKDLIKLNDWKPQTPKKPKSESTEVLDKLKLHSSELGPGEGLGQIRGTSRELKGEEQIHDDSPLYRESQDIPQRETAHVEKAEEEFQGDIAIVENQQQPKDASSDYGLCSGSKSQSCQMEPLLDLSPIEQCPICSYEHCVCRERLDEQTKEFMEELQNRLHKTDQPEDKPNDTEKSAAICCEFCDDPHICSLMSKDLTGDTKLPSTMEDDYLKIIFKLNSLTQSLSDVIPVETEKETKDNSGQKVKKVTYVKAEDSNLFDPAESTIITPKASRSVSIVGVERYVESDDSLIIYVEPLSWYASESTK